MSQKARYAVALVLLPLLPLRRQELSGALAILSCAALDRVCHRRYSSEVAAGAFVQTGFMRRSAWLCCCL